MRLNSLKADLSLQDRVAGNLVILEDSRAPLSVRLDAAKKLGAHDALRLPEVSDALHHHLDNKEPSLRAAAAEALAWTSTDPRIIAVLSEALEGSTLLYWDTDLWVETALAAYEHGRDPALEQTLAQLAATWLDRMASYDSPSEPGIRILDAISRQNPELAQVIVLDLAGTHTSVVAHTHFPIQNYFRDELQSGLPPEPGSPRDQIADMLTQYTRDPGSYIPYPQEVLQQLFALDRDLALAVTSDELLTNNQAFNHPGRKTEDYMTVLGRQVQYGHYSSDPLDRPGDHYPITEVQRDWAYQILGDALKRYFDLNAARFVTAAQALAYAAPHRGAFEAALSVFRQLDLKRQDGIALDLAVYLAKSMTIWDVGVALYLVETAQRYKALSAEEPNDYKRGSYESAAFNIKSALARAVGLETPPILSSSKQL